MSSKALTVYDLKALKGVQQISFVQVARVEEAIAASAAGIDMIGTGFRSETSGFARAVPNSHFQFGLKWGQHSNASEALRGAMEAMEAGAQSIYCAMSPQIIEVLAREGVPVIAHVGLVPPKATWTGGFKAVGKTYDQAIQVWTETKAFENAGAFAVEMEVVPSDLAELITQRTNMLTISLGSGAKCDVQYLFSADLLGENTGHFPRHAKAYRNFAKERERLQSERINAYREYISDVQNGSFPEKKHQIFMKNGDLELFQETVDSQS